MTQLSQWPTEFNNVVASSLWRSGGTFALNVSQSLLRRHGQRQRVIRSRLEDHYLQSPTTFDIEDWSRRFDRDGDRFLFAYRDLRDVVASDMQRGAQHFEDTGFLVAFIRIRIIKDRFLVAKAKAGCDVCELRFETEINRCEHIAIAKVAIYLRLDHRHNDEVFEKLCFERISKWYQDQRRPLGDLTSRDSVYHFHDKRLGDRRVGKFREILPESMLALMYRETELLSWIDERGYGEELSRSQQ